MIEVLTHIFFVSHLKVFTFSSLSLQIHMYLIRKLEIFRSITNIFFSKLANILWCNVIDEIGEDGEGEVCCHVCWDQERVCGSAYCYRGGNNDGFETTDWEEFGGDWGASVSEDGRRETRVWSQSLINFFKWRGKMMVEIWGGKKTIKIEYNNAIF